MSFTLLSMAPPEDDDPPWPPLVDRNRLKETEDEEVGTLLSVFDSPLDFFAEEGLLLVSNPSNFFSGWKVVYRPNSL